MTKTETDVELAAQYSPWVLNSLNTERWDLGFLMLYTGGVGSVGGVVAGVSYLAHRYVTQFEGLIPQVLDGVSKVGMGAGAAVAVAGLGVFGACIVGLIQNAREYVRESSILGAWIRVNRPGGHNG